MWAMPAPFSHIAYLSMKVNEGMKKALIIGGAGFVGKYLAEYLCGECGYQVRSTKMKQETKATIAYWAAIIFVIICIALMAVTPAYGQNQTVIKDSKGEVVYVKIKTASGYIVKDKNGVLLYTVVENDTEKRVYDASGRLISVEKKAKN